MLIRASHLRTKDKSRVDGEMSDRLNSPVHQPLSRICNSNEPERDVNARTLDGPDGDQHPGLGWILTLSRSTRGNLPDDDGPRGSFPQREDV